MDIERLLISKIAEEQSLQAVLEAKIQRDWFADEEYERTFGYILDYYAEYSAVPTDAVLEMDCRFSVIDSPEPMAFYIDKMKDQRLHAKYLEASRESIRLIEDEDDARGAFRVMAAAASKTEMETSRLADVDLTQNWEERLRIYREMATEDGLLRGIPMGLPTLDSVLGGAQDSQLITLVGLPKSGKSALMMWAMIEAAKHGKSPLYISFEMSQVEQQLRYDAFRSGVSYTRLLKGQLADHEMQELERQVRKWKGMQPVYLSTDITSATTVSGIGAKIETLQPDIVFIDGVYLMDDEEGEAKGSPQALTNITRSFKRLAMRREVPIVISTQALEWKTSKRRGLTSNSVGYSSSFVQDSDAVLGVETPDDDKPDIKRVKIILARSAAPRGVLIKWDWMNSKVEEVEDDMPDADEFDFNKSV